MYQLLKNETQDSVVVPIATPIIKQVQAIGQLLGHSQGTVKIEPIVADIDLYSDKIEITDTTMPIVALDSIFLVNDDGTKTSLDIANATINANGLSFTHTQLALNDVVFLYLHIRYIIRRYRDNILQ